MGRGVKLYQQTKSNVEANEVNPYHMVKLLMQGVLDKLSTAKAGLTEQNYKLKGENIGAAISIVGGLQCSLDFEQGKEIAENLNNLYDYIAITLTEASKNNDIDKIDEVINLMSDIKSGWDAIENEVNKIIEKDN